MKDPIKSLINIHLNIPDNLFIGHSFETRQRLGQYRPTLKKSNPTLILKKTLSTITTDFFSNMFFQSQQRLGVKLIGR